MLYALIRATSRYTALFILLILGACSQQPAKQSNSVTQKQSSQAIPNTWNIKAKLGIRSPNKSGSVSIDWQQREAEYHLRITGPFGQGGAIISGNDQNILIERAGQIPLSSDSPEQLIRDTFGWDFPLRDLAYWVRGLPSPHRSNTQLEYQLDGTLTALQQAVWSIRYERYKPIDQWLMPSTVRTHKDGVNLKLIIKQWQFPQGEAL